VLYLRIHFSDLDGRSIRLKKHRMKHSATVKNILILIATRGRGKCEMSCYCTHTVQAGVNRDSRYTDQWTNGRMCSAKTHAYWKRPLSISVSYWCVFFHWVNRGMVITRMGD